ncbi:hypothetical protein P692DRAFT_20255707, partial [Suillus brevipes Sb2]
KNSARKRVHNSYFKLSCAPRFIAHSEAFYSFLYYCVPPLQSFIDSSLATSAHDYRLGPILIAYLTAAPSHTLCLTQDESQSNQTFHTSLPEQHNISRSEAGT